MKLKPVVENLEGLSKDVAALYTEKDGAFHIQVEGMVEKSKLDEFRERNITLMKDNDKLTKDYEGVDLEEYNDLKVKAAKIKEKKLIDSGKIDELVADRVTRIKEESDKQIQDLTANNKKMTRQLEGMVIDNEVQRAAVAAKVTDTAIEDVLYRARGTFSLVEGKAIPKDKDGQIIYGLDGVTPMSIQEWTKDLESSAPHLFKGSSGSGSQHGSGSGQSGSKVINREQFDKMDHVSRAEFFNKGGKIEE